MQPSSGDPIGAQSSSTMFEAYRWKMILLALFIFCNVLFLTIIITFPSDIVSYIFFGCKYQNTLTTFIDFV